MIGRCLFPLAVLGLIGCAAPDAPQAAHDRPANRWADDRLWNVLQAQDHRDASALCAGLGDPSAAVREAAALALASVQDSTAMPCLLPALADTVPAVRRAAAFALSFSTDTVLLAKLETRIRHEPDSAVRAAMVRDTFRAALGRKKDAVFILGYLESSDPGIRTRAAAMLGRCPKEQLWREEPSVVHAVDVERDPDVRALLVLALRHATNRGTVERLKRYAASDGSAAMRVNALRALGRNADAPFLLERLNDTVAAVRQTVVERLQDMPSLNGEALREAARHQGDPNTSIPLYGLALRYGGPGTQAACQAWLDTMAQRDLGPYLDAAVLKARFQRYADADTLKTIALSTAPSIVRQAAFEQWSTCFGDLLKNAEVDQRAVDRSYALFLKDVLRSSDAGSIAAACQRLEGGSQGLRNMVLSDTLVARVRAALHPIRDLEARQLLDAAIAKRDGKPVPPHTGPAFNHPIDRTRLLSLKEGPQYRITTTKGEIVLALEPNTAPGSCVAFDSLVTAGYYNGKYLHRIVPNFVAQGGCPRGDGYGSMDWTLRTEIGYEGFTTGAVGLASAGRDTESCQFFLTLMLAPHLDGRYTRFAHVISGMDVAQRLVIGDRIQAIKRMAQPPAAHVR